MKGGLCRCEQMLVGVSDGWEGTTTPTDGYIALGCAQNWDGSMCMSCYVVSHKYSYMTDFKDFPHSHFLPVTGWKRSLDLLHP